MLKIVSVAALLVPCLAAPAFAAVGDDMQAQSYRDPFYYTQDRNANPGQYRAFNRDCPAGTFPHSFPNGNGVRCELPDGGYDN